MHSTELVGRYARAAFALAGERACRPQLAGELADFCRLLDEAPALRVCLYNPALPAERKRAVVRDLLGEQGHAVTRALIELLIEKRRERLLPPLAARVAELLRDSQGLVRVHLTSAMAVGAQDAARWQGRLSGILGRQVELETTVDPHLLGGVVLRVGHRQIDGSCRGQLDLLWNELSKN